MRTVSPSPLLKTALAADAAVSGAAAVLQLAAADWLVGTLMLPRPLLVETGAFLVAYTILLVVLARSARLPAAVVATIVLGNVAWAVACVALVAAGAFPLTGLGVAFLIVQALAVLVFAALEYAGLKRSEPLAAWAAGTEGVREVRG
jgi:hypothetical protein